MKRILTTLALTCLSLLAFAQNHPGLRIDCAEASDNDERSCSIFGFTDEDGNFSYYLSLISELELVSLVRDDLASTMSFSHINEICLRLGSTSDEVFAALDGFLEVLEEPKGSMHEYPAHIGSNDFRLGPEMMVNCVVVKRFLEGKRLCFIVPSGRHTAEIDLTKPALKALRWNFKVYLKFNPAK